MLAFLISIVLFAALVKVNSAMKDHKEDFINNGVPEKEFTTLRLFILGYLIALLIINAPIKKLAFLVFPAPFILLVILPGILKGKKLSARLETSGTDRGASAGDVAHKVMALGIAIGSIIILSWGWCVLTDSLVYIL